MKNLIIISFLSRFLLLYTKKINAPVEVYLWRIDYSAGVNDSDQHAANQTKAGILKPKTRERSMSIEVGIDLQDDRFIVDEQPTLDKAGLALR